MAWVRRIPAKVILAVGDPELGLYLAAIIHSANMKLPFVHLQIACALSAAQVRLG